MRQRVVRFKPVFESEKGDSDSLKTEAARLFDVVSKIDDGGIVTAEVEIEW